MPHPRPARRVTIISVLALAVVSALASCTPETPSDHQLVIIIDRTGVAQSETWSAEVAAQTHTALEAAVENGIDQVELVGLGSNTDQVVAVATADLTAVEGNTSAKREESRQRLISDISSAAAQVAAAPVDTNGTNIFASLRQASSLCQAPEVIECSILVLSDLEDQRVTALSSPDDAVDELGHLMPGLSGVSVQVSGLGASGADAETVEKVRTAWERLLGHAGVVDVRIARSL